METLTFKEIMAVSIVLPILFGLSILCVTATFERWIYFARFGRVNSRWLDRIRIYIKSGNLTEAKKEASRGRGLIAEAVQAQIDAVQLPRSERESLLLFYHQRFQALLQKRLWVFGTLSFICPLLGLLGTVLGVMRSFRDLALSGSGGPTIVAAGISEALIATAAGIAVAITAAVIYNWFNIWMRSTLSNCDIFGHEIIFLTAARAAK
ncbi:MAG: MotA/TolQ/ExbB proton channel family protein [Elusimicrobia bacterium]|nr:MotA/TolQ/ExbB proton channel family protein [Candidatus Obscuribacterium magneticum]